MKQLLRAVPCAVGLAVMFLGPLAEYAHARGGRGGGFSREGPAASGSFAAHSGSMQGHEGSVQSSHQQYAAGAQASRQQYGASAQSSRQQEANRVQSSREGTAMGIQSSAQQYHRPYPYAASVHPAWDAGAGVAAATTGAAIGAVAASSMASAASTTAGYAASQPCPTPVAVAVGSMTYFKCGSAWYTQAYGPAGPTFVEVNPPSGF